MKERLLCTRCRYVGKHYKLYNEVPSSIRGRKAAQINVGSQIGVASTSIGNTGFRRIMNTTNIIAPSPLAMQKQANKVNTALKSLNERSMCDIRKNLVAENAKIGQQDPFLVNVEGDTCYNNPIFKSDATPFQAETIAISTMCKNNTKDKQIVGVLVSNKLCRTSSMSRNKGQPVQCPNHWGHCTANVSQRESMMTKESIKRCWDTGSQRTLKYPILLAMGTVGQFKVFESLTVTMLVILGILGT
ncbi:hypothetical protein DPMN_006084 [Dreissena polymorpha]|uniref:Mutator-like transposase domain-containing protein n=1 Tax=Dreissena polymorpha TaxID=45954 RepID=A0A9D4MRD1_DREPO|nr:hypothetical protein DPMN_006084 [Dreissena polymorpha]